MGRKAEDDEREEIKVKLEVFLSKWELKDLMTILEQHPGWPEKRPTYADNFRSLARRGAVLQALAHSYSTHAVSYIHLSPPTQR